MKTATVKDFQNGWPHATTWIAAGEFLSIDPYRPKLATAEQFKVRP